MGFRVFFSNFIVFKVPDLHLGVKFREMISLKNFRNEPSVTRRFLGVFFQNLILLTVLT